jgi:membrane-bound metal-dependent hydrolase YbcI (DUF457 family)
MFIGHYGPAYAIKRWQPQIPIFTLFMAVQLVDVAWAILVLLGVEKVRIVPGITATNPLDLYYMPYTHSLVAAVLWSAVAGGVYALLKRQGPMKRVAVAIGLAVFSHWLLDLLVHRPDLPLYDNTAKVGLGLWNYPAPALAVEIGSLVVGLWLYLGGSRPRDAIGRYGPSVLVLALVAIQLMVFFGRPPESPGQAASMGLVAYFLFAGLAAWLDRHRILTSPTHGPPAKRA